MNVQVSTRLKLGVMWDHNGTYMDGIGFQYRDHQVTVEPSDEGQLAGERPHDNIFQAASTTSFSQHACCRPIGSPRAHQEWTSSESLAQFF